MKRLKDKRLAARAMWAVSVLFLALDGIGKLLALPPVLEGTAKLGYPERSVLVIGIIELACLTLYVIPRTAVWGALLLTGYLGGAVATHLRLGNPLFSHILFPTYVAALIWGALILRHDGLRQVVSLRRHVVPGHAPELPQEAPR